MYFHGVFTQSLEENNVNIFFWWKEHTYMGNIADEAV